MKKLARTCGLVALILGTSLAMGCSSGDSENTGKDDSALSTISGHVTAQGSGSVGAGLAGQGTLGVTKSVRASAFADGKFSVVANASLDVNGSYSLSVPANLKADFVLVEALDGSGQVVGSSILEASSHVAGGAVVAAPISTESSIEAKALADLAVSGSISGEACVSVAAELHGFVDASVEAQIAAAANAGIGVDALVHSVAKAGLIAHAAHARALSNAHASVDAHALAQAQIDASATLSKSLDATIGLDAQGAATASLQANIGFSASVDAAISGSVTADVHANAKATASLAFNAAFSASLDASVDAHADVKVEAKKSIFLAVQKSAKLEADATVRTMVDALTSKKAPAGSVSVVQSAGLKLQADINVAVDAKAIVKARADFLAKINANCNLAEVGFALDLALSIQASFEAALGFCLQVEAGLDIELNASLEVVKSCSVDLDKGKVDIDARLNASFDGVISGYLKVSNSCPNGGGGSQFTPVPRTPVTWTPQFPWTPNPNPTGNVQN